MSEFAEIFRRYRDSGDAEKPARDESEEGEALRSRLKLALLRNAPVVKQGPNAMKIRKPVPTIGTRG